MEKRKQRLRRARKGRMLMRQKNSVRLCVNRTPRHIYAQIIDEENQKTIFCSSSLEKKLELKKGSDKIAAFKVGESIAEKAQKAGFKNNISFDRGSYIYHGRVKELAEGARSKGLKF